MYHKQLDDEEAHYIDPQGKVKFISGLNQFPAEQSKKLVKIVATVAAVVSTWSRAVCSGWSGNPGNPRDPKPLEKGKLFQE